METFESIPIISSLCKLSREFGLTSGKCTPVKSFGISCHPSLPAHELVQIANSCTWWAFRFHVGVAQQAINQEKVYTQKQLKLKLTHTDIANLNSHATVTYLRLGLKYFFMPKLKFFFWFLKNFIRILWNFSCNKFILVRL